MITDEQLEALDEAAAHAEEAIAAIGETFDVVQIDRVHLVDVLASRRAWKDRAEATQREIESLNETLDEVAKERDKAVADFTACADAIEQTRSRYRQGRRTLIPNDVDDVVAAIEKAKAIAEERDS